MKEQRHVGILTPYKRSFDVHTKEFPRYDDDTEYIFHHIHNWESVCGREFNVLLLGHEFEDVGDKILEMAKMHTTGRILLHYPDWLYNLWEDMNK